MRHQVAAAHGVVHALVALDVALGELAAAADVEQVLAPAGGEVVKDANLIALAQQSPRQLRADEPAPACDQDLQRFESTSRLAAWGEDGEKPRPIPPKHQRCSGS